MRLFSMLRNSPVAFPGIQIGGFYKPSSISLIRWLLLAANSAFELAYTIWLESESEADDRGTIWIFLLLLRALLPGTPTGLVSFSAVAWQYTLQHFRKDIRDVMDAANNLCARATIAHTSAKEDVDAAIKYEHDALVTSNQALRDARLAESIKASDFFDAASNAWSAIETAAEAAKSAKDYGASANTAAENARQSYSEYTSTSSTHVNAYANSTRNAVGETENAYIQARAAMNVYTNFQAARKQDTLARNKASEYSRNITSAVKQLTVKTASLQSDLAELAKDVQGVRYMASQAVAKAEQGRLAEAAKLSEKATNELKDIEEEAERIAKERKEVRRLYVSQITG
ncbi:hypothetical protein GQ44DRAFT_780580 [Phaeosphaeriaceae sp. PMI808]|nr:hypothetical protein GQ44DRAFT_780580 [Phaeosphaeriaceae sp. PMI808]